MVYLIIIDPCSYMDNSLYFRTVFKLFIINIQTFY